MKRVVDEIDHSSEQHFFDITDSPDTTVAPAGVFPLVVNYILTKFSFVQRYECVLLLYWTCTSLRRNRRVLYILSTGDFNSRLVDRIRVYRPCFAWLFPGIHPVRHNNWFRRLETFQWAWHMMVHPLMSGAYHTPSYREFTMRCPKTNLVFPYVTESLTKPRLKLSPHPQTTPPEIVYFWQSPSEVSAIAFVYHCITHEPPLKYAVSLPGHVWFIHAGDTNMAMYHDGQFVAVDSVAKTFNLMMKWNGQSAPVDDVGKTFDVILDWNGTDDIWESVLAECSGTESEIIGFFLARWFQMPSVQAVK